MSTPQLGLPPLLERLSAQALYQTKGRILGTWDKSLDPVYVEMGQAFWYLGEPPLSSYGADVRRDCLCRPTTMLMTQMGS